MTWSKHPSTKDPERYHLDCTTHRDFKASVIVTGGEYLLHIRGSVLLLKEDYLDKFSSLQSLNRFLKSMGLEPLTT